MKVRIDIDTRTFVRFWLVVIGFALVAFAIYSARTALIIVGTALFLALALNPLVSRLARIIPGKSRVLGTALSYVAVVIVLGAFIFLVVPPIVQQTAKLVETVPALIDNATKEYHGVGQFIDQYQLQPQVDGIITSVKDSAASLAGSLGKNFFTSVGSILGAVTATILVLVLTFFMLVEGPSWMKRLWHIYTDKGKMQYHKSVLGKMYTVVTSYVNGQLIVSALDGATAGLVVFILSFIFNIPANFAIPTAAIMFVFSLIPMFGATIGAIIVGLVLAFNDLTAAIIFIVFFIIYQQIEGSYISPKVQSKKLDLSALAILISVTIGIYLFGIAGGIISIPIAGIIKILVEEYLTYRKQRQTDTVSVEETETATIES